MKWMLFIAALVVLSGCEGCNELPVRQAVVPTAVAFATTGELLVGGYGEELDVADETSPEPRGDFYVARVLPDGSTLADSWVGTPEPERLRGIAAAPGGGMVAYGASLTAVCDDSAWHQRGAVVELSASGTITRATTFSRSTMTDIAGCSFPEQLHLQRAVRAPDRMVVVGDWSGFTDEPSSEGLTVASYADELQWSVRFDDEATLGGIAITDDVTYVATVVGNTSILSKLDATGTAEWSRELPWTVSAMTARDAGADVAGLCASGEVCAARISSDGAVVASLRFDELEAETVGLTSDTTIAAWDGTKVFFLTFDEDLALQRASFVEAGASPMALDGDRAAWVLEEEVQAWKTEPACGRTRYQITDLASSDAGLEISEVESPWLAEELVLESWQVVAQPRGYPIPTDICL